MRRRARTWNYQSIAKGYSRRRAGVAGKMAIPTWKSELYFEYHRGVYHHAGQPQAQHARGGRGGAERGEVGVLGVARWQKYPGAELTEDWKKVLFNQFHDLAAGSGIGVIYKDAQKDYDVVRWSTNEISSGRAGDGWRSRSTPVRGQGPFRSWSTTRWAGSGRAT